MARRVLGSWFSFVHRLIPLVVHHAGMVALLVARLHVACHFSRSSLLPPPPSSSWSVVPIPSSLLCSYHSPVTAVRI